MISLKSLTGKKEDENLSKGASKTTESNIFGKTLSADKVVKSKKAQYIESKNKKQSYLRIGLSILILVLYSVFFFYSNAVDYLKAPAQIAQLQGEITNYEEVLLPSLEKTKELHKAAFDKEFEETIAALETVFPEGIDKLGIVRLFESFAVEVDAAFPPFEFTSINLGKSELKDNYVVTPASTSIHSSLAGFDKFLSLVDRSGMIYLSADEADEKTMVDKKIRLMSISNISISYRGVDETTGKDQGVDFSVKVDIYSRPLAETEE